MPYSVVQRDGKFCVVVTATGKQMGCHDTRRKALRQLRAIKSNEKHPRRNDYQDQPLVGHGLLVQNGLSGSNGGMGQVAKADVTHVGLALKANNTGRVLMLQRSFEEKDPAAGKWEFPGGGIEEKDHTPLHAAIREWEEEVGLVFPFDDAKLKGTWYSENGKWQGFLITVPRESVLKFVDGHIVVNPDDPDGDAAETAAWWFPQDAMNNPAIREECKDTPWMAFERGRIKKRIARGQDSPYDADKKVEFSHGWKPVRGGGELPDSVVQERNRIAQGMKDDFDTLRGKGSDTSSGDKGTPQGFRPATADDQKRLKYPPAWKDVVVTDDPHSALLARGRDAKGNVQSMYSAEHTANQAAKKFARVQEFVKKLDDLDNRIDKDWKENDNAAALMLIRKLGMRPGSDRVRGAQQVFGATNMRAKHVDLHSNEDHDEMVSFSFVGKKGVEIGLTTDDPDIVNMIRDRMHGKSGDDPLFDTNETKVRQYFNGVVGQEFNLKDLRTTKANVIALEEIEKMDAPETKREFVKARAHIGDVVSKALGNTRTVALASYVNPTVFHKWEAMISGVAKKLHKRLKIQKRIKRGHDSPYDADSKLEFSHGWKPVVGSSGGDVAELNAQLEMERKQGVNNRAAYRFGKENVHQIAGIVSDDIDDGATDNAIATGLRELKKYLDPMAEAGQKLHDARDGDTDDRKRRLDTAEMKQQVDLMLDRFNGEPSFIGVIAKENLQEIYNSWAQSHGLKTPKQQRESNRTPANPPTMERFAQSGAFSDRNKVGGEHLHGGAIGDTRVIDLVNEDGEFLGSAVYKYSRDVEDSDAEELASIVGSAIGANVPYVSRINDNSVMMEFIKGKTAFEEAIYIGNGGAGNKWYDNGGKELALLDYLIGNSDRHAGNFMVNEDGKLVGIDHGFSFHTHGGRWIGWSEFRGSFGNYPKPDNYEELKGLEEALEETADQFRRVDRMDWYGRMMNRYRNLVHDAAPEIEPNTAGLMNKLLGSKELSDMLGDG